MKKIEFSIIIPLYNQEKYIKKCTESALNQNFEGTFEVIIINDGSKDKSRELLKDFKDERLLIIDNDNHGVSYSRNFGLEHANGKYIIFLDADDYLNLNALKNIQSIVRNDDVDVIIAPFYALREDRNDIKLYRPLKNYTNAKGFLNIKNTKGQILNANMELCTKAYKKDFLTTNNIDFPPYKVAEDLPFFYKVMALAEKIKVSNQPFYYYRKGHKASFKEESIKEVMLAIKESSEFVKKYEDYSLIKKAYTRSIMNVCLYWCKKFKKLNNSLLFCRFCLAEIKSLNASLVYFIRFYFRLFIINLIDI